MINISVGDIHFLKEKVKYLRIVKSGIYQNMKIFELIQHVLMNNAF